MFREFKVGELFDIVGNKQVKSQKHIVERADGIPFVVQSTKNNMVKCHVDRQALLDGGETVYEGNAIVLGVVSPVASYQEHEFGASQSISLRADFLNPARGLYLVTVIRKVIESKYSYTNLPGIQKYKEDVIQLPVKPGTDEVNYTEDDIDWAFMESYIHELEESYIHELEESYIHELDAYLKETGLDDYTLTDDEREVLEREPVFKEFEVGELFDVHPTKAYKLNNSGLLSRAGSTPVVVNSSQNNGIGGYSELEPTEAPGILTFSDTTTGQNTLFYQNQPFIGYSHVQGMYPKNFKFNNLTALFMVATLRATLGKRKWDYSNKLNRAIVIETQIQLPVKQGTDDVDYTEADIDWVYMDAYVRVMEKLVIADVVDYKNEVIATTKGLIKN